MCESGCVSALAVGDFIFPVIISALCLFSDCTRVDNKIAEPLLDCSHADFLLSRPC